jgi:hypothetical protein
MDFPIVMRLVAPLLLARLTVIVAVHLGIGAMFEEIACFRTGSHLGAHRAAVATE